jgi:predicted NAD/FAD-dependent oxidoreductase/deoxyribodipyrimidine photolyase
MTDTGSTPAVALRALLEDLPEHLRERVHVPSARAVRRGAPFVLYWMRTAVRGHENAALDVALEAAGRLETGVLVYHALSERYPFASDRHHRFILDGARDVEEELAARGIPYAFHLEREGPQPGCRGRHLVTLAERAALVVTEDATWGALRRWTASLSEAVDPPLLLVDSACVFPSRLVPAAASTRAYRFRDAISPRWDERLAAGWTDAPVPPSADFTTAEAPGGGVFDLPFSPMDFRGSEGQRLPDDAWHDRVSEWIACCRIDHAVPPIPGSPGGSRAGYARWAAFRDRRLGGYAHRRNDALADGVSRLSPYLHYGHVSPLRIAAEARRVGGKGADKFLDELLVWRELAHAFCMHEPNHGRVSALPDWARQTLASHEADERPALPSWAQLARAKTGDALWDAAQRSLLVHGELHNNVRMTWGKSVLGWTPDAATALEILIDLNHRYALDGRDPNSYAGILWCLGGLDRPFEPEKPIFGRVRPRSTDHHARRLDVDEYVRRTRRPAVERAPRVAVVGAGVAGLACANTLVDQGWDVVVVDKARRPGGRANTRESRADATLRFDHGAQFFTARDARFRRFVDAWVHEGWVAEWRTELLRLRTDGDAETLPVREEDPRWVAVPGMQALCDRLADGLDVRCGVRVARIQRTESSTDDEAATAASTMGPGEWVLHSEDGAVVGSFDTVVVTAPPAQAADLFDTTGDLEATAWAGVARGCDVAPTWAALFEFVAEDAPTGLSADAILSGLQGVAWAARDSSKPGRATEDAEGASVERWVVHGSADFSREHIEADSETVAELLLGALVRVVEGVGGRAGRPRRAEAHRWRYALVESGPDGDCRVSRSGLAWAGDVFDTAGRARIEAAWLSGVAAAGRLMNRAGAGVPAPHPGEIASGRDSDAPSVAQGSLFE